MFDKFREECGVVAIHGHPEAANLAYLGLYALQHRGQESAGIASTDGREIHCYKSMGHVADIFTPSVVAVLNGGRHRAAERAAIFGGVQQGQDRRRTQREHHQRWRAAP
jgi:glutamine phosphoribosylpyrophosphate amidotransferase